jgi:hypothetical protein
VKLVFLLAVKKKKDGKLSALPIAKTYYKPVFSHVQANIG